MEMHGKQKEDKIKKDLKHTTQRQPLISVEIDTSTHFIHTVEKYIK